MRKRQWRSARTPAIRAGVLAVCAAVTLGSWTFRPDDVGVERAPPHQVEHGVAAPQPPRPLPIIGAAGGDSRAPSPRVARPVRLRIPVIDVDTALQPLGLERNGSLEPPSEWGVAGWYAGGPRPGQPGPAVIVGHIDSTSGPAVFFRLRSVHAGDDVLVTTRGGGVLRFVVDDVAAFPKSRFPTWRVYGPQPLPVLRLITCTGAFDPSARSYVDNLIVSAHLATAAG